jgi:hypothetical protein
LPGNAVDIGNQFFVAGMCHGLSLDKFWRYVSENAGADKDAYGYGVNPSGTLPHLQAGATQLRVSRAWHSGCFIVDHTGYHNHYQGKQANGYFVLGQHNQKGKYAQQTGKAGPSAQDDKKCGQRAAHQCRSRGE